MEGKPFEEGDFLKVISILRTTNNLIMFYINHYIFTKQLIAEYNTYQEKHHSSYSGQEKDIIEFIIAHNHGLFLRKFEQSLIFQIYNFWKFFSENKDDFFISENSVLIDDFNAKFHNLNRLISFVRIYVFYLKKIDVDFHLMDMDQGETGEAHQNQ